MRVTTTVKAIAVRLLLIFLFVFFTSFGYAGFGPQFIEDFDVEVAPITWLPSAQYDLVTGTLGFSIVNLYHWPYAFRFAGFIA